MRTDTDSYTSGISLLKSAIDQTFDPKDISADSLANGMPFLLRLISGDETALALAYNTLTNSEMDLKAVAIAFVKQACLAHSEDPYRVLGLTPWCAVDEVRERYRQLIRIFHPDRGLLFGDQHEPDYAAILNVAYQAILQGGPAPQAQGVDFDLRGGKSPLEVSSRLGRASGGIQHPSILSSIGLYKLTPLKIWSGLILGAMVVLTFIYLDRQEAEVPLAIGELASNEAQSSLRSSPPSLSEDLGQLSPEVAESPNLTASEAAANISLVSPAEGRPEVAPPAKPPQTLKNLDVQHDKADRHKNSQLRTPAPPPQRMATNSSLPPQQQMRAPVIQELPEPRAMASAPVEADVSKVDRVPTPASTSTPPPHAGVRVVHLIKALPSEAAPSDDELNRMVSDFVARYNQGDLEGFMSLMDDQLQTDEPGGKGGLRQAYARLFSQSSLRAMQLDKLNWQKSGDLAYASTEYQVRVLRAGASQANTYHGVLKIEVAKLEDHPRIRAFYHIPDRGDR